MQNVARVAYLARYSIYCQTLQPADIGWPTGNGEKLNNSQACCLAQLCLGAA